MGTLVAEAPQGPPPPALAAPRSGEGGWRLPLLLHLSPRVPEPTAAALRVLIRGQPRYAGLADTEEGALCVLPDFNDYQELSTLERRRCRVIGLPFAERILRDPTALQKVHALPLYDLIYCSSHAVCCSGLSQAARLRASELTRWMGARFCEDLDPGVAILVAQRVSLHPDSKYQAALARSVPIVRVSYLEAMWQAKQEVDMTPHLLPPLCGLGICLGGIQADVIEHFEQKARQGGAVIELLDRAEVVIVKDVLAPRYAEARKHGILTAPPLWLDYCLKVGCCWPIAGELEVVNPKSLSLPLVGGRPAAASMEGAAVPAACPSIFEENENGEIESGIWLATCVVCLAYLPSSLLRCAAKALAWRCGAATTMNPFDIAITHVVFQVSDQGPVHVSVPTEPDRVSFVDISWLEACAQQGARVRESQYLQQRVIYNPGCDFGYKRLLGRQPSAPGASVGLPGAPVPPPSVVTGPGGARALTESVSAEAGPPEHSTLVPLPPPEEPEVRTAAGGWEPPPQPAQPPPQLAQPRPQLTRPAVRTPPCCAQGEGVFHGRVLGLLGWAPGDSEAQALVSKICNAGATAVHGGGVLEATGPGVDLCVCRGFGPPLAGFEGAAQQVGAAFVTVPWVEACLADATYHPPSSFLHFEPGPGSLPLESMRGCTIRITGVHAQGAGALEHRMHRMRRRLEELVEVLGAKVAMNATAWRDITQFVCVMPEYMEAKLREGARKRNIPVVSANWLFDCFSRNARQPEDRYSVDNAPGKTGEAATSGGVAPGATPTSAANVLTSHTVLMSPSALGGNAKLPQMAETLGATVHTWRNADELVALLKACGALSPAPGASAVANGAAEGNSGGGAGGGNNQSQCVVLVDKDEAGGHLAEYIANVQLENPDVFVLPSWLAETFAQRRRLPLVGYSALQKSDKSLGEAGALDTPKRQRLGEAAYAWQSAAQKKIEEIAEDSRARAKQSKVQQQVTEGLRLAELRREPSRLGG